MVIEVRGEGKFVRLPTFLEKGFADLKKEVIARKKCSFCGTCIALCDKIVADENRTEPKFVDEYETICGMCYTFCPRVSLSLEEIEEKVFGKKRGEGDAIGVYRGFYAVRTKKRDIMECAQDGGAVTSILAYALSEGIIDCAVVTGGDNNWKPVGKVVTSYEGLREAAGTRYTVYPSVAGIKEAFKKGYKRIGFVGLPCQIQGLRKMMTSEEPYEVGGERIKLLIGLFCMENFKEGMVDFVIRNLGLDIKEVEKFEIKGKKLWIHCRKGGGEGEVRDIPLSSLKEYVNEGCLICEDFTAELADISIGSVGSDKGWSTVITRTEVGEELIRGAEKEYIEVKGGEVDIETVKRVARKKREKCATFTD
ncbi:MAG: Coenzyme F420 hydrogenase/dehydrogenase, beta subunit C-terminal domain [Candidatus Methanospirareceae archaeon]